MALVWSEITGMLSLNKRGCVTRHSEMHKFHRVSIFVEYLLLLHVLGHLIDEGGDLRVEAVPGVDVVVAETETSWQNHKADILFARIPCLLVQADRQRVRHYSVILR